MDKLAIFSNFIFNANLGLLIFLVFQNSFYVAQLIFAYFELQRNMRRAKSVNHHWLFKSDVTFPISVLVPAYNEEATIVENIRSLLSLHYPDFEVIVVNDGSTDHTLKIIIESFSLEPINRTYQLSVNHQKLRGFYGNPRYPKLIVVDKENGGKADALNAGINLSRCPLICSIDADSILDADGLLGAVRPFIEEPERMVAVGGTIRIANGCTVRAGQIIKIQLSRQWLVLFQTVEYLRAFLMSRLAWTRMKVILIISGAFGVFKRQAVIQVGGYSHHTVGEDMELVVKLHRYFQEKKIDYEIRNVPDPVCWTEAPSTFEVLRRQRTRWQRGMLETLFKHRQMLFSPRYGLVGLMGLPAFFIMDALGPLLETFGYLLVPFCWLTGTLSIKFFFAYLALTFAFGVFVSAGSFVLAEITLWHTPRVKELLFLTVGAIVENFGYRQLNNFLRLEGTWQFLHGKQGWGKMPRIGFLKKRS